MAAMSVEFWPWTYMHLSKYGPDASRLIGVHVFSHDEQL